MCPHENLSITNWFGLKFKSIPSHVLWPSIRCVQHRGFIEASLIYHICMLLLVGVISTHTWPACWDLAVLYGLDSVGYLSIT